MCVSRARGSGGRARHRHGRGARRWRRPAPCAAGLRRRRCSSMRLLHARARCRHSGAAPADAESERGRDPRGAVGEPLPLHGLHQDFRRRADGGDAMSNVLRLPPARELELGRVGESVKRVDGVPKTTGEFEYASDLSAAGMLWGHTLRSPHAHARLHSIDLSDALTLPGVRAVLTHDDVPGQKTYGLEFADQPVLAIDRVRYFGEPVAVVAAEHPEQARRAAERIVVEYETLEPIVDPERATESEPLHPDRPTAGHGYRDDPRPNVVRTMLISHGNPDTAGEISVSGHYELGTQDQAFLGPESGLAVPDGDGGVDIYVATQWLHACSHC